MKERHLQPEQTFYSEAFSHNLSRRTRKFSWETTPSKVITELVQAHNLDKNTQGKRVLDLGCGDGRHSAYFISLGYEVVGVDFCEEALQLCRQRCTKGASFHEVDLTEKGALQRFGTFDIVIDWSVLDHIRKEYLTSYLDNIRQAMKDESFLFVTAFDESLPGLFKHRNYKVVRKHYSKAYTFTELVALFPSMILLDARKNVLEDDINTYRFHTLLMKGQATTAQGKRTKPLIRKRS